MPLFEFECLECKKKFEKLCHYSDLGKRISCSYCHSSKVNRLFSIFGLKTGSALKSSTHDSSCKSCSATSCSTCRG
jgi:putative FmdB family regulatory protein